jgi:hypothetical protein
MTKMRIDDRSTGPINAQPRQPQMPVQRNANASAAPAASFKSANVLNSAPNGLRAISCPMGVCRNESEFSPKGSGFESMQLT